MALCKYSSLFGNPGQGAHSYRVFNIAIVDVLLTLVVAFLIAKSYKLKTLYVFVVLFLISIVFHRLFCVKTTVDKFLFGDQ